MVARMRIRLRGWAKGGRLPEGPWPEGVTAWGDYTVSHYEAPHVCRCARDEHMLVCTAWMRRHGCAGTQARP